jgi:hypothetical protein
MHTLLDLHGNIPTFIRITDGKVHDVTSTVISHKGTSGQTSPPSGGVGQSSFGKVCQLPVEPGLHTEWRLP